MPEGVFSLSVVVLFFAGILLPHFPFIYPSNYKSRYSRPETITATSGRQPFPGNTLPRGKSFHAASLGRQDTPYGSTSPKAAAEMAFITSLFFSVCHSLSSDGEESMAYSIGTKTVPSAYPVFLFTALSSDKVSEEATPRVFLVAGAKVTPGSYGDARSSLLFWQKISSPTDSICLPKTLHPLTPTF